MALEGYRRLLKNKGFTNSIYVNDKVDAIHGYSDIVYGFLKEEITVTGDKADKVNREKLYEAYEAYHKDNSGDRVLTKKGFTRRLSTNGVPLEIKQKRIEGKKVNHKYFTGIKLNNSVNAKF